MPTVINLFAAAAICILQAYDVTGEISPIKPSNSTFKENLTLADLESFIKAGIPVIIAAQAWRDNETASWTDDWDDGHYMIVIGLDEANVYLEEASILGSRGYIPRQEFMQRGHDYRYDSAPNSEVKKYMHAGIFIKGKEPAKHLLFKQVD